MKIDVSKIKGFAEMTPEEQVKAVLAMDVPDAVDLSQYVPKSTADKYATEAAANKKALAERQTEEERAAAEQKAAFEKMQSELETLKAEKAIAEHKASFASLGWDDTLATETAKALAAGDMTTVFANQKRFNESREKAIRAEVLKGTPAPTGAAATEGKSDGIKLAEAIGKSDAKLNETSNTIIGMYTGEKT